MARTAASLVRDFFLAPAHAARPERIAPVAPVLVVLGPGRVAVPVACAVALELARRGGQAHAAVCLWPGAGAPASRAPASRGARRAAARAAARGCAVDASGRLVRARLPDPPAQATAMAQRVAGAANCPVAIALAGPRSQELDTLLTLADAVLLARRPDDPAALTRLAEAGLARLEVPVVTFDGRLGASARLLATAGLAVTPAVRGAVSGVPVAA